MKLRHRETEYGPIRFKDFEYKDLLPYEVIHTLTKEQVFKHITPYSVKNNIRKAQFRTGKYLYQLMWKVIVDQAMAGNLVDLPFSGRIYIGVIDKRSTKHTNFHTYGKVYGLKLHLDKPHGYRLKMRKSRRIQLMKNLKEGKNYPNY
jgi:hypothetical protein